jgi:Zn-dependent M28 family amino/carboxypeptidase
MPMNRRVLLLFVCLCPALALAAGAATPDGDAAATRIRAHIAFLADDLLEGRAAGTRGYDLAARYVAAEFVALGLKPGGVAGGWFQPIELIEGKTVVPAGELVLERGGRTERLESATHFLPLRDYSAPESSITAPLEFVGFGVSAPERGYDDFDGVDLKGKIAVELYGAPANFGTEARAHYSASLTKMPELVRRGAIGVILVLTPVEEQRTPWERWVQRSWFPGMRWIGADGQPVDAFPSVRRGAVMGSAGAARLFDGAERSLADVYRTAAEGRPQHFALPGKATLAGQTVLTKRQSANVIGVLEGADPLLKHEYVVLSAHLDHLGRGAAVGGDEIYHGALDNAAGVAVMLEVAHMLETAGHRPKRSVLFLALTAEERGLLGSDVFARHPTVPGALVADINMDMPAALGPLADWVAFGAEHSTLGPIAARAAAAEGYALSPDPMPEEVVFVRSDQYMFVRQGVPSIYIDTGSRSKDPAIDVAARVDAFLRNNYHMPSDNLSLPIHYPSLAGLARINARILNEVANAPKRPAWNAGDFFGSKFAPPR